MKLPFDKVPHRPGFVVTAAVWQKDRGRMRLKQVCYESRGKRQASAGPLFDEPARRRRGLVGTERRPAD